MQIARVPHTYYLRAWYLTENKEVPDRNIGVPPVRKYANYRTMNVIPKLQQNSFIKRI